MVEHVQAVGVDVERIAAWKQVKMFLYPFYDSWQVEIKVVALSKPLQEGLTDFRFCALAQCQVCSRAASETAASSRR